MREKKSWADLTQAQRVGIVAGGAFELVLTVVALQDLVRRPATQVRGPKSLWATSLVVQPFGPIAYFLFGRRAA